MDSTGESRDSATLHLGAYDDEGTPVPVEASELPSLEEQRRAHDATYEQPDQTGWVTFILGPKDADPMDERFCHWAGDGSDPASGRMTPRAVHVDGCPHADSRYVNFVPTPVDD